MFSGAQIALAAEAASSKQQENCGFQAVSNGWRMDSWHCDQPAARIACFETLQNNCTKEELRIHKGCVDRVSDCAVYAAGQALKSGRLLASTKGDLAR